MPKRIQRQRTKGYRMPEGAVYVGRPSGWGSPFRPGEPYRFNNVNGSTLIGIVPRDRERQAYLFDQYINTRRDLWPQIRAELGGRDLACWCPLDERCHADALLRIANSLSDEDRREIATDVHQERTQDAISRYQDTEVDA